MVVTEKKDVNLRICLDPKDLNSSIKRSHYPMPRLDDITSNLHGAKGFSTFDAKTGYWQIPIPLTEKSSELTTFNTPFGRYKWLRLPFGWSVASEEFQRRMIHNLQGLYGVHVIADDILVVGRGNVSVKPMKITIEM